MRATVWALLLLSALSLPACESEVGGGGVDEDVRIDESLGSLKVANSSEEPVAIYLDGQELFTIAPGRSYTFRNLPTGPATIYGVGRVSQKHHGLPELTIEEGGDYEWTIRP
jgi:hypothetical protein